MVSNVGHGLQLKLKILQRFQNGYLRIIVNAWYVTNDIMILTYHTLEMKLKDSARDTPMKEHPNIFATHERSRNNTSIKKKTSDLRTWSYRNFIEYMSLGIRSSRLV